MIIPKSVYLNEDTQKLIQRLEKRVGHELKLKIEGGDTPYVEIEKLPKSGYSFITTKYLDNLAEHFLYDGYKEKSDSFIVYLDPAIMYTKPGIQSSVDFRKFSADDIFDQFDISQLTGTVFMDREEYKNAKCGMDEFTDLMWEIVPTYLGVQSVDDVREVCNKAKNPQAKAFLEAFETAMENAKFTDKFYDSVKVHKKGNIHSSRRNNMKTIKSANNIRDLNYYECPNCHEPELYHGKDGITCYNCGTKVDENDLDKLKIWVSPRAKIRNSRTIKSSVRDDFARGLQNIMREKGAEFADGTLEDNMIDIYDNYVQNYYEEELEEEGGEAVAEDWFRNTYYDDEEGIFIHNSRSIKSGWSSDGFEDKISDFIKRFRDAGYITPLDAEGFIEDLHNGRVEEMDLAWIMDAIDADLSDSTNESFYDKIADKIRFYSKEGSVANSSVRRKNMKTIKSEFEIGDEVIVTDESQDLNEVEGTVTDIVDDKAEVVFESGDDSWVDLDKIESACHGKSKKDKEKKDKKKKSIKSSLDEKTYQEFRSDMFNAISEVYKKYNFNTGMNADKEDFDKVIEWMDIHGYWDDDEDSMM